MTKSENAYGERWGAWVDEAMPYVCHIKFGLNCAVICLLLVVL